MFKIEDKVWIREADSGRLISKGVIININDIFGEFTVRTIKDESIACDKDGVSILNRNHKAYKVIALEWEMM
ncbi:MAG: hypothetical protein ACRC6B_05235 [Fusobacteriaceae bacterium]